MHMGQAVNKLDISWGSWPYIHQLEVWLTSAVRGGQQRFSADDLGLTEFKQLLVDCG